MGRLKAKLAKLKSELMGIGAKSGGKAGDGFDVTKSGDTRVGLIGFPSVGKSTLLTVLTGTESEAASYECVALRAPLPLPRRPAAARALTSAPSPPPQVHHAHGHPGHPRKLAAPARPSPPV